MRELGEHADALHAGLAPAVVAAHVDRLILIGEDMRPLDEALGDRVPVDRVDTVDDATEPLCASLRPGDAVLVKASNSVGLAKLVERVAKASHALRNRRAARLPRHPQPHPLYQLPRRGRERDRAAIGLLLGPWFISWLRAKQGKGQPIRADGPQSHLAKRGTPTMGGLLILTSVAISVLLWMDLRNHYVWACLLVTGGFGLIGWLDDYDKVRKAHHAGLSGKTRLALEFLIAGVATWMIVRTGGTGLHLPFVKETVVDLGWFYILFGAFVIVAFGNAVNLTDGLDGLATMPVIIASIAFLLITYLVGNAKFATYLGIPHVLGRG